MFVIHYMFNKMIIQLNKYGLFINFSNGIYNCDWPICQTLVCTLENGKIKLHFEIWWSIPIFNEKFRTTEIDFGVMLCCIFINIEWNPSGPWKELVFMEHVASRISWGWFEIFTPNCWLVVYSLICQRSLPHRLR